MANQKWEYKRIVLPIDGGDEVPHDLVVAGLDEWELVSTVDYLGERFYYLKRAKGRMA
jgi:hypothetical protein